MRHCAMCDGCIIAWLCLIGGVMASNDGTQGSIVVLTHTSIESMAGQQEDPELRRILEAEVQRAQFQQQALGLTGA